MAPKGKRPACCAVSMQVKEHQVVQISRAFYYGVLHEPVAVSGCKTPDSTITKGRVVESLQQWLCFNGGDIQEAWVCKFGCTKKA